MNKFVIYTNPNKDKNLEVSSRVKLFLEERGAEVSFFKDYTGDYAEDVCMIVLGGDGTMLRASMETGFSMNGPMVGINLGTLGFLAEIENSSTNIEKSLEKLLADDYKIEKRMLLEGSINGKDKICALNDVVLARKSGLYVLNFKIFVNNQPLANYSADGIIVSTPTGSTGYNLSAGGPIASPASELIMLTPICPHTLNHRSLILSSEDEITIVIPESKEGGTQELEISFDGSRKETVHTNDSIVIRRSDRYAKFAKIGKDSFVEVLNRKMNE